MRRLVGLVCLLAAVAAGDAAVGEPYFPAGACSCRSDLTELERIHQDYQRAVAVLVGEVRRVRAPSRRLQALCQEGRAGDFRWVRDCNDLRVKLRVERAWKGVAGRNIVVWTPSMGSSCRYRFEPGTRHLVYAMGYDPDGELVARTCTRTRPVGEAQLDFDELGEPVYRRFR